MSSSTEVSRALKTENERFRPHTSLLLTDTAANEMPMESRARVSPSNRNVDLAKWPRMEKAVT